jgi:amino acid transporter
MIFFLVCGGAYGTEDLVSSIPPFYALLAMALSAFVWSIPIALMTAELAIAVPHDAAYIEWTRIAFGSLASKLEAAIVSICLVIDQAVYPKIFVAYATQIFTFQVTAYWQEYLLYVAFALLTLLIATFGIGKQEILQK